MRKWVFGFILAAAVCAATADVSEARHWRRGRSCCCPPPCYVSMPYAMPYAAPFYQQPGYGAMGMPSAGAGVGSPPAAALATVTIKGKTYRITSRGEAGENDREELEVEPPSAALGVPIPDKDVFKGKARRIAKTSIFAGEPQSFDSISALRDSLPSDEDMMALGIGKGPTVPRVEQEQVNVTVPAFIYAFRKEADNDYHVIIGDAPDADNPRYLNAEVSGIPTAGTKANRDQLWAVRKAFEQAFQLDGNGPDRYFYPDSPVPVQVTGSLFFDVEHMRPNTVGPKDVAPGTAWEIHPISNLEFR